MKARNLSLALFLVPLSAIGLACAYAAPAAPATRSGKKAPAAISTTAAPTTAAPCSVVPVVPQRHLPPYTAKQETTRVQTLADGTHITTVTETQVARDSVGRTRSDFMRTQADGSITHTISVYDPVTRTRFGWSTGFPTSSKTVTVQHIGQPVQLSAPPLVPAVAQRYYPTTNASLPPQTIAGVYATGNRTTRTIPAGYEDNDRDITVSSENWFSSELGIALRYVIDDPRNGKNTMEVTDLQRSEPDPSLFTIPEGYTVRDTTPQRATP